MRITGESYSQGDLARLRQAIADKKRPYEIRAMFPHRTERGIYSKIRYEKNRIFNKDLRFSWRATAPEALPPSDADAVSDNLANKTQDAKFQAALKAAIEAGRERHPAKHASHTEFRPAHFESALTPVSEGSSPALSCVEFA